MPELIQCPKCNRKLRVPDNLLGKKVKCPSCSTTFTAAAGEEELPTAPLIEEEESPKVAPRKPPPRPREEAIEERSERPRRRPRPPEDEDEEEDETEADDYEDEEEEERPRRRRRPIDEDEDEEEEGRPRREGRTVDWVKVRQGITFVLIAICVAIGGALVVGIAGAVITMGAAAGAAGAAGGGRPPIGAVAVAGGGMVAVVGLNVLVQIVAEVLTLIGYVFCMNAPQKYNARTLAVTTVVLAGANLAFTLLALLFAFTSGLGLAGMRGLGFSGGAAIMNMIAAACNLGKYFTFLLFLIAVARCIRVRSLEKSTRNLTILSAVGIAGTLVWFILTVVVVGATAAGAVAGGAGGAGAAMGGGLMAIAACGCIMLVVGLAIFVWYIVVLAQTRAALSNYLARR
ncbi:MAG TPA: MJ0042-type zinc finger domain-containing protein [Gemmataceae bacterium]|jgi:predicted Zn finger-like uncharacterized protein|nr:MJ0042-type zinc finger domain-containing protein [Gemmataceae bacterium]